MAQRKIIWSQKAKVQLFEILDFYKRRNENDTFSKKLYAKFSKHIHLLVKHPYLGVMTDFEDIRGLIVDEFIVFYEVEHSQIIIHTIWECNQNPEYLVIK